jgi:uncharacterized protein YegL
MGKGEKRMAESHDYVADLGEIETAKAFEQLGILVLDGSGSMTTPGVSGQAKAVEVHQAVQGLMGRLRNSRRRHNFLLAVITYDHRVNARRLLPTFVTGIDDTGDYNPLSGHGGNTAIGAALEEAYQLAEQFLAETTAFPRSVVIIVMSDGKNNAGLDPLQVAERIKNSGQRITVCAAGYGKDQELDEMTLKRLVSDAQCYKFTMNTNELRDFFEQSITQVRG